MTKNWSHYYIIFYYGCFFRINKMLLKILLLHFSFITTYKYLRNMKQKTNDKKQNYLVPYEVVFQYVYLNTFYELLKN